MNVSDLRDFYSVKNNSQLAKKINYGKTTVWEWEKKGIPSGVQAIFELTSKGKLKADLCPSLRELEEINSSKK